MTKGRKESRSPRRCEPACVEASLQTGVLPTSRRHSSLSLTCFPLFFWFVHKNTTGESALALWQAQGCGYPWHRSPAGTGQSREGQEEAPRWLRAALGWGCAVEGCAPVRAVT